MSERRSPAALERRRARKRMRYTTDAAYREREKARARRWRTTFEEDAMIRNLRSNDIAEQRQAISEWSSWGAVVVEFRNLGIELNDARYKQLVKALKRWADENAALRLLQDPQKVAEWLLSVRRDYPKQATLVNQRWEME